MNYRHFLLTRFNLPLRFGCQLRDPDYNPAQKILDDDYLEKRFDIFERFTLKSVKEQTDQDFTWIVLFHKRTPAKYLKRIRELKEIYYFEDLYFDEKDTFTFSNYCVENDIDADFYITSRIDNDDMIDKDYMKLIHDQVDGNLHKCFISFVNGAKLDLKSNKLFDYSWDSNHFITYVDSDYGKSVYNHIHSQITKGDVEIISLKTDIPMWTEIIHDTNVYNRIT